MKRNSIKRNLLIRRKNSNADKQTDFGTDSIISKVITKIGKYLTKFWPKLVAFFLTHLVYNNDNDINST